VTLNRNIRKLWRAVRRPPPPRFRLLFATGESWGIHVCGATSSYIVPLRNSLPNPLCFKNETKETFKASAEQVNSLLEGRLGDGIVTLPLHGESLCEATLGSWSVFAYYRVPKPSSASIPTRDSWRCPDVHYSCLVLPFAFGATIRKSGCIWCKGNSG